ncbi:oligopeptide transporter [Trichodelitschia bisporula]|uniref:Oligopeptide transporter n=1 Tax=Trichodelitschia bisporula TaxID=703511 RepID=A0A6G1HNJ8_9PEZI|nr:oligopeptide transporter [Trichodelitschia bisporula]
MATAHRDVDPQDGTMLSEYNTKEYSDAPEKSNPKEYSDAPGEEKIPVVDEHGSPDDEYHDAFAKDPFTPFNDLPEERPRILTIRAVFIGLICGVLVNASNLYLGLKSGWTFGANLFGAIAGFAIIKFFSKTFANVPILGGSFGPRENNIVQTAAMASGGLSNVFVSAFPALYQLGLMDTPKKDFWRIVSITVVGGYFGFFFATPLRKFFILYIAREMRLIFPSASATAMTIRSMHDALKGEAIGKMKMKALSAAFIGALVLRVVSQYAVGILWEWHFFTWFFIWGHFKNAALAVENWGWFVQFTPAFIGSGMLVGMNVSVSFFAGSVIAWLVPQPFTRAKADFAGESSARPWYPKDPKWNGLVNFASFDKPFSSKDTPSPRFWLLWPGVLAMVCISFTELLLQWRILLFAGRALGRGIGRGIYDLQRRAGKENEWLRKRTGQNDEDIIEDIAEPHELVKMWMWLPGLIMVIIAGCLVMYYQYQMPVGMSLLSIFLAFFFSFLAIQCTGVTDITPLTAASKASQVILGGATRSEHWQLNHSRQLNLLGGALANMGANQSTDLTQDFRTGFLLRTPPLQQWIAQGIGTFVAIFIAPLMFQLFMTAYPCIITRSEPCAFSYPSAAAWHATAIAVTDPSFPIPKSSGIFSIVFSIFGSAMVLVKHYMWVGKLEWVRAYHPNMMCIALAFVLPQTYYGTAMIMGATIATVWAKRNPHRWEILGYAVAAGLIAGEGIGGVINAILQIAGGSGDKFGSNIACPKACD